MNLFPSEKKAEYYSRFGRALKANHLAVDKRTQAPTSSPKKEPIRLLTRAEIEVKIESVNKRLAQVPMSSQSEERRETASFLSISREQRNKVDKMTHLETPSPVHYSPQFQYVQKRSLSTKLIASKTHQRLKRIALPGCVDETTLDCTRSAKGYRPASSLKSPKAMLEETYLDLLQAREGRRISSIEPRAHIPCFQFNKQLNRIGIPLNSYHESQYETSTKVTKVVSPTFNKFISRPGMFDSPGKFGPVYDYDKDKIMKRMDLGLVKFQKMSPRVALQSLSSTVMESPDLHKLDMGLFLVQPHTHIRSPNIAKALPRDDFWILPNKDSPKRSFLEAESFTMEIKRNSLRTREKKHAKD